MKKIAQFRSKMEAHIIHEALLNRGIKSELTGAREYASIVTGGIEEGKFELLVEDENFEEAKKILAEMDASHSTLKVEDQLQPTPSQLIRKSITMAFLGIILLPIVFNIASIMVWLKYLKIETNQKRKVIASVVILGMQLLAVYGIIFFIGAMGDIIGSLSFE